MKSEFYFVSDYYRSMHEQDWANLIIVITYTGCILKIPVYLYNLIMILQKEQSS